ncbi:SMC-Scp complex subunit ScpB, partial [Patescibacteria group bacterium]|nr:SMC-Scp complex subunit ScpB [Patescibacteria group bacterium]
MSNTISQIESILFVASKPLSVKKITKTLQIDEAEVLEILENLRTKYNQPESGIVLFQNNEEWQLVSNPGNREAAENFIKAEISGELTRPQLETLTVVAYCGPITKPEMEQIRGVNCSLILRNLMMRGLVKETEDITKLLPVFEVTMDYLRHIGLVSLKELPDYAALHKHESVSNIINAQTQN